MTTTQTAVRQRSQIVTAEDWMMRVLLILGTLWLLVGVVLPLYPKVARSFQDPSGKWIGFANYIQYLTTPALAASFFNSLYIAIASTVISVLLAFIYAYALTRTAMRGKNIFRILGMLPLYIPPLAHAIGLIYLLGNQGIVTTGLFGLLPGWNIGLYGANGIIIGEVLYCFPQALVILITALSLTDARLYEASEVLGSSPVRTFLTVTLPGVKYGLMSAIFVCFTLAFTDFGVPKVVGGNFNVLATDIYKQVIGQQNFAMGATISVFLLIPTVVAFIINQIVQRRQTALVSAKAVPLQPKPNPVFDGMMFGFCTLVAGFAVIVLLTIVFASLIQVWPYNFTLGFKHYDFSSVGGGGYDAYWNSIQMSFYTAVVGTIAVFISAYPIDPEFEAVSAAMSVPFYKTFWRVTVPLSLPAILEIGIYYFVNAMITISAIIFLYPPTLPVAAVAIVNMDDAGDTAAAAAMSALIVFTSIGVRILYWFLTQGIQKRTQAWLQR